MAAIGFFLNIVAIDTARTSFWPPKV
jgi:hypothetical protein